MIVIYFVPFLYYLQYLLFNKKGNLPRRLSAKKSLIYYLDKGLGKEQFEKGDGHMDTALHVLAHCWELENRPDKALQLYQRSLKAFPTNNIARKHLVRLSANTLRDTWTDKQGVEAID